MFKSGFILFFCIIIFLPEQPALAADKMLLAVHPYLSPDEIQKKFSPLANFLSEKTGKKIYVRVGSSYQEHIDYIGNNKVDIAYMGPASFVSLQKKYGDKPVLAKLEIKGRAFFKGNIIVSNQSSIKSLNDLKGKRIAFGSPGSTMSYIVPHYMLHKAGVFNKQSADHDFLQSHNNVALAVLSGDFDAGAVKPAVFRKFEDQGLRVLAETPEISEHLFVVRSDMSKKDYDILKSVMLNMNKSTEGKIALQEIKKSVTSLVDASADDYQNLREIINESERLH